MGVSVSVLQRYIGGKTYPDLESILELIDSQPGFLNSFLENLTPSQENQPEKSMFSLPWVGSLFF